MAMSAQGHSATWLRSLVECLADAILLSSGDGRIEFINRAAEQLLGISAADAFGEPLTDILQIQTSYESPIHGDLQRLATLNGSSISLGRGLVLCGANGKRRDIEGEIAPFEYMGSIQGLVVTLRDVTFRNRDDINVHRNQTLQAVTHLAGSIAHDLNNLLTLILGYSDQLLGAIHPSDRLRPSLQEIRNAGDEAAKVCERLQLLSRRHLLLPQPLEINTLLEQELIKLQSIANAQTIIQTDLVPMDSEVLADPEQMREMLATFILHGNRLLPEGGNISFQTAEIELTRCERGAHRRRYVQLLVTYSGEGMIEEELDHLFKPRLQQPGGLDLFLVAGIVSDANGHITVDGLPGVSTTVEVLFPRIEAPHPLFTNEHTEYGRHEPTILLVEDDDNIRALLGTYFGRRGYHLLEARDGEDALLVSDLYEGLIDILITDVAMPHMNGPQLMRALASIRPETKVLFISGYSAEHAEVQDPAVHFLQKPFSSDELLLRVQQILGQPKTRVN